MTDNEKLLLYGGGGLLVWFEVVNPLLQKLGLQPSAAQAATNTAQQAIINNAAASMTSVCSTTPSSKSDAAWLTVANNLYDELSGEFPDSVAAENTITGNVANDCDMLKLISALGNRAYTIFGIAVEATKTLPEYVTESLLEPSGEPGSIEHLNATLLGYGLTYQF